MSVRSIQLSLTMTLRSLMWIPFHWSSSPWILPVSNFRDSISTVPTFTCVLSPCVVKSDRLYLIYRKSNLLITDQQIRSSILSSEKGKSMEAKTILIVEDDDACRSAMEKVLQSHNYKTFSCASGKHALVKLKEKVFGILITDFQMRGMDGLELIRGARGIHPGISTILVTGLATEDLRIRVNEQGVNGIFPKPIEG